jgi:hypothetical protein
MTALTERVAADEAAGGEQGAADDAVARERFGGVIRTRRQEPA